MYEIATLVSQLCEIEGSLERKMRLILRQELIIFSLRKLRVSVLIYQKCNKSQLLLYVNLIRSKFIKI